MKQAILLALLCFGLCTTASAENEVLLWNSASVRYKPHKQIKFELSQHFRFDQNITQLESIMPELEMEYRPTKWIDVGVGYRYIYERTKNGDLEPAHRYHIQAATSQDFGPIELSYRLRYQEKHEVDEYDYSSRLRNKLSLEFDTDTAYSPILSAELFLNPRYRPFEIPKYRIAAGSKIKLHKHHRLTVRYFYQPDLTDSDLREHIVSMKYQYRIPKKKKEKQ